MSKKLLGAILVLATAGVVVAKALEIKLDRGEVGRFQIYTTGGNFRETFLLDTSTGMTYVRCGLEKTSEGQEQGWCSLRLSTNGAFQK